jgi:hypothetical protein
MSGNEVVNALRTRAIALLQRPCCISKDEGSPSVVELIQRYVAGKPLVDGDLSRCLRYALVRAEEAEGVTGPEVDAQHFYHRAAGMLRDIQADLSAGRG